MDLYTVQSRGRGELTDHRFLGGVDNVKIK